MQWVLVIVVIIIAAIALWWAWPLVLAAVVAFLVWKQMQRDAKASEGPIVDAEAQSTAAKRRPWLAVLMAGVIVLGIGAEVPWGIFVAKQSKDKNTNSSDLGDGNVGGGGGGSSACSISCIGDSGDVPSEAFGAFDVCKQFVSNRLKAPGGATWRDPFGNQVTYSGSGDGPWTVDASVDSENGFGAKLRSTYTCTVTNTGGDSWRLVSLNVNDGGDLGL